MIACESRSKSFEGTYKGYFAETTFNYHFNKDGSFAFKTNGHLGNFTASGKYLISDPWVILIPDTDWNRGILKEKMRIIDVNCLRDNDANYYCTNDFSEGILDKYNDSEIGFQTDVIKILNETPLVKSTKTKLMSGLDSGHTVEIVYNGILLINREEYHRFSLDVRSVAGDQSYLDFVATKTPFRIFQHLLRRDSLILLHTVN